MTEAQLSDQTISEIRLFSDAARANQNYLSLKDVALLTSMRFSEAELRAKWNSIPELSSTYKLEQDLLLDPSLETREGSNSVIDVVEEKKARAKNYLSFARAFVAWTRDSPSRLISISGSTSYFSADSNDDLDFFVVSRKDRLWIFLFKSLVRARIFRLLHPLSPRICFSYAVDETFAKKIFAEGDPLLARDALNVIVIQGEDYYQDLVRKSKWISKYFPRLCRLKTEHYHSRNKDFRPSDASVIKTSLNLLLFLVLAQYIRIKSNLLNRQFLRAGKSQYLFTLRTGPDHCIFDSLRYSKLRQIYNQHNPTNQREQGLQNSCGDRTN
jgi:hypothetical protein